MTTASRNEHLDPGLAKVLTYIEAHKDEFLERLIEYLCHPSISPQNVGMDDVAELLLKMLRRVGLEARAIPTKGYPVVLASWNHAPNAPTVLLYGHYDTMSAEPLDAWASPPFEPAIRNRRVYARGAGDNKGQHFAQILAVESYLKVHGRLPCNVTILLEGEEEIGSPNLADFASAHRDLLKVDLVVTADGPQHESGRPIITYGVRGVVSFELRARGANRDVHSGNLGGVVPNPVWTLVHLLASMKDKAGNITIPGFHDDIVCPTELDLAAAALLPSDANELRRSLGFRTLDAPVDRPLTDRLMFHPTLSINGLHGGYSGPGMLTIVPGEAFVKCDSRLVHNQDPGDILNKIEAHVKRHAPDVEFVRLESTPPSKTPLDAPFSRNVQWAVSIGQEEDPLIFPALGATLPDHVFTKLLGSPSFVIPYANADEANHAPNENISVDCFIKGIRTGAALLYALSRRS
ncbi:M20/M25/M40 family metallo-hydrolase [Bradyrhizobium embrapense]|uniref:M20/M25/M40 family metallo-hydrolase n=1 Tax=Bradyrhizobium embrapense TaxID=630921 RepID=UPI000A0713DB|nr:M20/M25/M40 family metallo-hydrolase [Bradyrhizobium embrapense]